MNKLKLGLIASLIVVSNVYAMPNLKQLEKELEIGKIISINKTPISSLYEVSTEDRILYTDDTGKIAIIGEMFNIHTKENMSLPAVNKIKELKQSKIETLFTTNREWFEQNALIEKIGNGEHKLYMFTNPDCKFCRALEPELKKLTNTTIYRILIPSSINAIAKVDNIWCSADKLEAWYLTIADKEVLTNPKCDTPTMKNAELSQKLQIQGTPTMFNIKGQQLRGVKPISDIESFIKMENIKK